jgi:hypothetical protein
MAGDGAWCVCVSNTYVEKTPPPFKMSRSALPNHITIQVGCENEKIVNLLVSLLDCDGDASDLIRGFDEWISETDDVLCVEDGDWKIVIRIDQGLCAIESVMINDRVYGEDEMSIEYEDLLAGGSDSDE